VVVKHGVIIIGYTDLPSRLPTQASNLYSTNLFRLTEELCKTKDGQINVNMEDEVLRGTTVVKDGTVTWPPPIPKLSAAPAGAATAKPEVKPAAPAKKGHGAGGEPMSAGATTLVFAVAAVVFALIGLFAPAAFLGHFTVFVLACFIGYMVVWNVTPSLHTPLMSVTNAISSIIIIGALVQIAPPAIDASAAEVRPDVIIRWLAVVGIALTAVNMFGGFAVTRRMLSMFRK
jgi:NAD(P) transhydrogenase subunit alpha